MSAGLWFDVGWAAGLAVGAGIWYFGPYRQVKQYLRWVREDNRRLRDERFRLWAALCTKRADESEAA